MSDDIVEAELRATGPEPEKEWRFRFGGHIMGGLRMFDPEAPANWRWYCTDCDAAAYAQSYGEANEAVQKHYDETHP